MEAPVVPQEREGTEPAGIDPGTAGDAVRRSGRGRGIIAAAIVLAFIVTTAWIAMSTMGKGGLGQDPFGRAAPDFTLPKLEGSGTISVSQFKGHPLVINFWASWCGPCKDEAPILAAAEKQWRSQGVIFLGVDSADERDDGIAFEHRYGIEYESAFDVPAKQADIYGVFGYPETFFVNAKGKIMAKFVGPIDQQTLDSYLAEISA